MFAADHLARSFRWRMLLTLLAMVLALGYLAHLKGVFEKPLILQADVDSGSGLYEGMKVTYKGFELGRLAQIELTTSGLIQGHIQIRPQHANFFTQGSTLKISKEKIVTSELQLIRDESNHKPLNSMAYIKIEKDDMASDVTKRLDPLLNKVQMLLTQLADPELGIQASLTQSRKVMQQTTVTLGHTSHAMQQIGDEKNGLPVVLGKTRDTMVELEKTLVQTQKALGSANRLMDNVDETVHDVKSAPAYKWLVPEKAK
jgi:phospholipid/cholesterol/gamma-HCH transport system substrate-binding protein